MACQFLYLFVSTIIFFTCGSHRKHWIFLQGVSSLPDYVSFKIFPGTPLEHIFSAAGDDLLELIQGLFTFNPLMRTTATQVKWPHLNINMKCGGFFLHFTSVILIIFMSLFTGYAIRKYLDILASRWLCSDTLQALKMRYFSNRPGPTPGPQLPRPNCSVEALREKEPLGLKGKFEGLDSSNQHTLLHTRSRIQYTGLHKPIIFYHVSCVTNRQEREMLQLPISAQSNQNVLNRIFLNLTGLTDRSCRLSV